MVKKETSLSDLLNELIGIVLIMGIAIGLVFAGVIWGIVELLQWIF